MLLLPVKNEWTSAHIFRWNAELEEKAWQVDKASFPRFKFVTGANHTDRAAAYTMEVECLPKVAGFLEMLRIRIA